jgi:hypothetical protein
MDGLEGGRHLAAHSFAISCLGLVTSVTLASNADGGGDRPAQGPPLVGAETARQGDWVGSSGCQFLFTSPGMCCESLSCRVPNSGGVLPAPIHWGPAAPENTDLQHEVEQPRSGTWLRAPRQPKSGSPRPSSVSFSSIPTYDLLCVHTVCLPLLPAPKGMPRQCVAGGKRSLGNAIHSHPSQIFEARRRIGRRGG